MDRDFSCQQGIQKYSLIGRVIEEGVLEFWILLRFGLSESKSSIMNLADCYDY